MKRFKRFKWEDRVQRQTVKFWEEGPARGVVYDLSQDYRPGGDKHGTTRQTPGLPDLIVVLARYRCTVFQEVKALEALEIRPHVSKSRWSEVWTPDLFTVAMKNDNLYAAALHQIDARERETLLRAKRSADQILLEDRLIGQVGIVYCCGGVEEAFATFEQIKVRDQ